MHATELINRKEIIGMDVYCGVQWYTAFPPKYVNILTKKIHELTLKEIFY